MAQWCEQSGEENWKKQHQESNKSSVIMKAQAQPQPQPQPHHLILSSAQPQDLNREMIFLFFCVLGLPRKPKEPLREPEEQRKEKKQLAVRKARPGSHNYYHQGKEREKEKETVRERKRERERE
ncbi:hypothetical protein TIFTF001_004450 [Ficus carica]|uniref:Uncharacterized protein n=1 Tax=Ficus carica TaxID=3494 RepID=A0AA87ZIK1_FICCA|nr:hypothetical protein TIFTF001_004450 [Ficus carica]